MWARCSSAWSGARRGGGGLSFFPVAHPAIVAARIITAAGTENCQRPTSQSAYHAEIGVQPLRPDPEKLKELGLDLAGTRPPALTRPDGLARPSLGAP